MTCELSAICPNSNMALASKYDAHGPSIWDRLTLIGVSANGSRLIDRHFKRPAIA